MIKIFKQLLSILDRRFRIRFGLLVIPMMVTTFSEILSIGMVIPVFQIVVTGESEIVFIQKIIDTTAEVSEINIKSLAIIIFAGFFIFKNIILFLMVYIINTVVADCTATYQEKIFSAYISKSMSFHFAKNSSDLLRDVTYGVWQTMEAIRVYLMLLLDSLIMISAILLLLFVELEVTVCVTVVLGGVGFLYFQKFGPIYRGWGIKAQELEGSIIKWVQQSFASVRDVKLFSADRFLNSLVSALANNLANVTRNVSTATNIPRLLIESVVIIGFAGVILILFHVGKTPEEIVGTLGLFGMAAFRVMPSMNRILMSGTDLRRRGAYITSIYDALHSGQSDSHGKVKAKHAAKLSFKNSLELRGVSYAYSKEAIKSVTEINIDIRPGESVGFVGPSGAGKSTLMDLILGFLTPDSGEILVDGKNIKDCVEPWRSKIGFVPQSIFLMDDTIKSNVAFGVDEGIIDHDLLMNALDLAQLEKFVSDLPDREMTIIGEHGARLSGGQMQRIAIARALYRNPEILVFDEATSSLDNITEREITNAIDKLSNTKTILIVAHRLSTVRNCDKIIFMRDGRIEAVGDYETLIKTSSDFRRFAAMSNDVSLDTPG